MSGLLKLVLAAVLAATGATSVWAASAAVDRVNVPQGDVSSQDVLAGERLLISVAQAGPRLVAVGEFGHILLSDDKGATWRQVENVPTRTTLTSVSFADDKVGWAVGHDTVILRTDDGGATWAKQFGGNDSDDALLSVLAISPTEAITVGAFAFAARTSDGGATWDQFTLIPDTQLDNHLNKLFRGKGSNLYIAAEFGTVFRSGDLGQTWEAVETGYDGSFWGGLALKSGPLLVVGMRGNIWRSEDDGQTWTNIPSNSAESLSGSTELDDGTVVVVGLGGAVVYSTDGGKTFVSVNRPDRKGLAAVAQGPDGNVVIFGEPGVVREPTRPES
ncbi:MAG: hypothetical protein GC199_00740 [Alphaproteobacteria bacterium]|nr:hypothetical protein [Alphaproteobacteria bacterium]